MFTKKTFLLLVYFSVLTDTHNLQVIDSGLMTIDKNDMVVVFFVTVKHRGNTPRRAMVTMIECCERITENDTDCDLIELYGGDFGVIQPGTVTNFTLLYPNVYGFNRKGTCLVNVLHRCLTSSNSEEIHHRIDFDTSVSTEAVPAVLKGWYDPNIFVTCDSPDLDPFDNCNPVNCQMKYSGNRNYYSRKWKKCQRVPICKADPNKELPDVAYVPNSNTCRDLEKAVTKEDIKMLVDRKPEEGGTGQKMVNIRCHHGEINPKTGLCVCDYGWKSEIFDPDAYTGQSVYSMCNIQCTRDDPYSLLPPMLGIMLAFWLFFCVICCEKLNCFCPSKKFSRSGMPNYVPVKTTKFKKVDSTVTAMVTSTKTSFVGFKSNPPSDFSLPAYTANMSEKTNNSKNHQAFQRANFL